MIERDIRYRGTRQRAVTFNGLGERSLDFSNTLLASDTGLSPIKRA
jgi:hypothetical protein